MKKLISFDQAVQFSLLLLGLFILFHIAVIVGIVVFDFVPIDLIWGGRMESREQLLNFEFFSLMNMVLCFAVVFVRSEKIVIPALTKGSRTFCGILFVAFFFSSLGSALDDSAFQKLVALFTMLTSLLCLRLAIEPIRSEG